MNIGIISDTHGYVSSLLKVYFKDAALILHAGDIGSMNVITSLEEITKVEAVRGNMDQGFIRNIFPAEKIIEVENKRILIIHKLPYNYKKVAEEKNIDVIVYGHTHAPEIINEKNLLLINPGTAGNKSSKNIVGYMRINNKEIKAEIIELI